MPTWQSYWPSRCSGGPARALQRVRIDYGDPGYCLAYPAVTLQIVFIDSASAIVTWTVQKEFEIAMATSLQRPKKKGQILEA